MRKMWLKIFLVVTIGLTGWILFDLFAPQKVDLKVFDADEVARLDTAMWRSYYKRERVQMYSELTELLGIQYELRFWRKQLVAYYAASAAFVFKSGKSRPDYELALPDLEKFYGEILELSTTPFDAKRAAQLELEWWIIHRERKKSREGNLAKALAETVAEIYGMPSEKFLEHGRLRAEAMSIRDTKDKAGVVSEEDWNRIDELLHQSWNSLHLVVNRNDDLPQTN